MLHDLLRQYKADLIDRCAGLAKARAVGNALALQEPESVASFLDQVIDTLRAEESRQFATSVDISGTGDGLPGLSQVGASGVLSGSSAFRRGLDIEQVVHGYGDVCQAVTTLAYDKMHEITAGEFRTLNRCLDNAIAAAVAEYHRQRGKAEDHRAIADLNEHVGMWLHEFRNHLDTANLALIALKTGKVGIEGATGAILGRALQRMRVLLEGSLATVRSNSNHAQRLGRIELTDFIQEAASIAFLDARARGCSLNVPAVDADLAMWGDREALLAALGNLLTNGFKFTQPGTQVSLRAYRSGDRIRIDIADHCGGLRPGAIDEMFLPFRQADADRTGLGLGLPICRQHIEASGGTLCVHDFPGTGCVFTMDLPGMPPK